MLWWIIQHFEAASRKLCAYCTESSERPLLDVTILLHANGSLETCIKNRLPWQLPIVNLEPLVYYLIEKWLIVQRLRSSSWKDESRNFEIKATAGFFPLGHVYMLDTCIIYTSSRACGCVIKEHFKSLKLHITFRCDSQYARHAQPTLFVPYCVAAATDCMPLCCSAALVYVCPCPPVTSSRWSAEALNMCSTRGEEGNSPLLISGGPGWPRGCSNTSLFQKQCVHKQNYAQMGPQQQAFARPQGF